MTPSVDPGDSLSWRLLKYWRLLAIAAAALAADQASKAWIAARLPFNSPAAPRISEPVQTEVR